MIYLSTKNKYFSNCGSLYTDEDLDYFEKLNREYQLPKLSFYELIELFPEAKPYVKRKLQKDIKEDKKYLTEAVEYKSRATSQINKICSTPECSSFYHDYVDICLIIPSIENVENRIKKNTFYLSALKEKGEWAEVDSNKITDQDIERAKQIPITNFLEVSRGGFAKCPFHNETVGSLKVYEKQNTWYCFSCNAGGDIIEYCIRTRKIRFLEAVKFLLNK